jgi:uncharacterized protein (DUF1919 family)
MSLPRLLRPALKHARRAVGRPIERALIGREPIALLAEDCWGSEFCRTFGCAYTTPLAGAFILSGDYLTFLENLGASDAFAIEPVETSDRYPVGRTPYATIHFMHARSWDEVAAAWPRRAARLQRARIFHKIDFGKSGYTQDDVTRWNKLALPNAIALLPPTSRLGLDLERVHRGWRMKKWTYHGAGMFHLSRRSFDFHHWIRTGQLRDSAWNRALNFLFWDKLVPNDLTAKFLPFAAREAMPTALYDRR